jgi:hypothetical protein
MCKTAPAEIELVVGAQQNVVVMPAVETRALARSKWSPAV